MNEKEEMIKKLKENCDKNTWGDDDNWPSCEEQDTCPFWVKIEDDTYYSYCARYQIQLLLEKLGIDIAHLL